MTLTPALSLLAALTLVPTAHAAISVIDFETLLDGDVLTNQLSGLVSQNTTVATAGFSLNESEVPPHSGQNVVLDTGGYIRIEFASPVSRAGGYFTYLTPITLSAFNSLNQLISTEQSAFTNNLALSGDAGSAPNEYLEILSAGGIYAIEIAGSPSGGSFALDDLTLESPDTVVPEPAYSESVGVLVLSILLLRRGKRALSSLRCGPLP